MCHRYDNMEILSLLGALHKPLEESCLCPALCKEYWHVYEMMIQFI